MKLSLIITNYNREKTLARAIRSCLSQIIFRTSYEVIVVDDASTDNSIHHIYEFDPDIRLIRNTRNMGVAFSSNLGVDSSSGEYWMRVDSDDFLNQFACVTMISILDSNPNIDFVYCDHVRVDEKGAKQEYVALDSTEKLLNHGAGVMFRRSLFEGIGRYDENLKSAEDYDFLSRALNQGKVGFYLPIPLYRYYIHGGNMTLDPDRAEWVALARKKNEI